MLRNYKHMSVKIAEEKYNALQDALGNANVWVYEHINQKGESFECFPGIYHCHSYSLDEQGKLQMSENASSLRISGPLEVAAFSRDNKLSMIFPPSPLTNAGESYDGNLGDGLNDNVGRLEIKANSVHEGQVRAAAETLKIARNDLEFLKCGPGKAEPPRRGGEFGSKSRGQRTPGTRKGAQAT